MKKLKTYVLTVSQNFPKTHNRAGQPTNFVVGISQQIKLHTIRGNYPLWKKRIEEVQSGEAILSVRIWQGKPYKSKQKEVFQFDKDSAIGIQDLYFEQKRFLEPFISHETSLDGVQEYVSTHLLARNDGLIYPDFKEWFKGYDLSEPMAIIHFTPFRY